MARWRVILIVVAITVGGLSASLVPTSTRPAAALAEAGSTCGHVYFLGARGSGQKASSSEPSDAGTGLGREVYEFRQELQSALSSRGVQTQYLANPAYGTYPAYGTELLIPSPSDLLNQSAYRTRVEQFAKGMNEGLEAAVRTLVARAQLCPVERIVLAGYSQGAMVMHRLTNRLAILGLSSILARIDGVALIADGDRVPNHVGGLAGQPTASRSGEGIFSWAIRRQDVAPAVEADTFHVCSARDLVCDFQWPWSVGNFGRATAIHGSYGSALLSPLADVIRDRIMRVPAPSQVNPVTITDRVGDSFAWQLRGTVAPAATLQFRVAPTDSLPAGISLTLSGTMSGTFATPTNCTTRFQIRKVVSGTPGEWHPGHIIKWAVTNGSSPPPPACSNYRSNWSTAWNLKAYTTSPVKPSAYASDVACPAVNTCWASGTGSELPAGSQYLKRVPWILRWNGAAWTRVAVPTPTGSAGNWTAGIACAGPAACWAVGYTWWNTNGNSYYRPLTLRWNGSTWAVVKSPVPTGTQDSDLYDVTCTTPSNCLAVGYYSTDGSRHRPLMMRWNGTAWSLVSVPFRTATTGTSISAVRCTNSSNCWAVGNDGNAGGGGRPLMLRWNGTAWSLASVPVPSGTNSNSLYDITCRSAIDCWAVGGSSTIGSGVFEKRPLILRWNGISWTVMSVPRPVERYAFLSGVACASGSNCWAVGYGLDNQSEDIEHAFIVRWNGAAWTAARAPAPAGTFSSEFSSATCASDINCWAVGESEGTGLTKGVYVVRMTP